VLPEASAHLACALLVALDVAARTLRMRVVLRSMGHRLRLRRLLAIGLAGDAAGAVTPCRLGGDAVRILGLTRAGVPRPRAALAVVGDSVPTWPVVLAMGAGLAWLYGRGLGATLTTAAIAVALAVVVVVVAAWRRLRGFSPGSLWLSVPLTAIALAARVAILPVLASAVGGAPPCGQVALASLTLLQSQSFLPTPAGAGAVEAGFIAAWPAGASAARTLLHWRLYTTAIAALLGGGVMMKSFARWLGSCFQRRWARMLGGGTCSGDPIQDRCASTSRRRLSCASARSPSESGSSPSSGTWSS
jgi:uncharacterized membrane protein YbhN (UPF0104 family)